MGRKDSQPQLKDQDLYEEICDKGNSRENSARISNAAAKRGRSDVAKSGGQSASYEGWTSEELKKRAKELDVQGCSKLKKSKLIDTLRDH
ncbi:DUF7218 family protein [Rhodococcus globerulus]|uniref:DUF7218 family protein n=1 Tax=Rhodococcus globerulus TaxID=33008 RepID=UPI001F288B5D|nr:Rho termination factor [Rhodococcus globerulus]MCE4267702.1 Rho termination factor [Rhodococcus globerulus]